jgi:hypothetical protein
LFSFGADFGFRLSASRQCVGQRGHEGVDHAPVDRVFQEGAGNQVWRLGCEHGADVASPRVADVGRLLQFQILHQLANVLGEVAQAISRLRLVRLAMAAQIGSDDAVAILKMFRDRAPARGEIRPAVNQQQIGFAALAPFQVVQLDALHFGEFALWVAH